MISPSAEFTEEAKKIKDLKLSWSKKMNHGDLKLVHQRKKL